MNIVQWLSSYLAYVVSLLVQLFIGEPGSDVNVQFVRMSLGAQGPDNITLYTLLEISGGNTTTLPRLTSLESGSSVSTVSDVRGTAATSEMYQVAAKCVRDNSSSQVYTCSTLMYAGPTLLRLTTSRRNTLSITGTPGSTPVAVSPRSFLSPPAILATWVSRSVKSVQLMPVTAMPRICQRGNSSSCCGLVVVVDLGPATTVVNLVRDLKTFQNTPAGQAVLLAVTLATTMFSYFLVRKWNRKRDFPLFSVGGIKREIVSQPMMILVAVMGVVNLHYTFTLLSHVDLKSII